MGLGIEKERMDQHGKRVELFSSGGGMRLNGTMDYILRDCLNSAFVTTGSAGNIIGQMRDYASSETMLPMSERATD